MSADFPIRDYWLRLRNWRPTRFMGWTHVSVFWEERTIKSRDEKGRPIEIVSRGPWSSTYIAGRNVLKRKLGRGAARKRLRRHVSRISRGFYGEPLRSTRLIKLVGAPYHAVASS